MEEILHCPVARGRWTKKKWTDQKIGWNFVSLLLLGMDVDIDIDMLFELHLDHQQDTLKWDAVKTKSQILNNILCKMLANSYEIK
jgi:hypothetical protein